MYSLAFSPAAPTAAQFGLSSRARIHFLGLIEGVVNVVIATMFSRNSGACDQDRGDHKRERSGQ